jgi:hypothetical protein
MERSANTQSVHTCTFVAGKPDEFVREMYIRIPVILPEEHHVSWLSLRIELKSLARLREFSATVLMHSVEVDLNFGFWRISGRMAFLATILITLSLAVPAVSTELFRYRGAAKDGGTLRSGDRHIAFSCPTALRSIAPKWNKALSKGGIRVSRRTPLPLRANRH